VYRGKISLAILKAEDFQLQLSILKTVIGFSIRCKDIREKIIRKFCEGLSEFTPCSEMIKKFKLEFIKSERPLKIFFHACNFLSYLNSKEEQRRCN